MSLLTVLSFQVNFTLLSFHNQMQFTNFSYKFGLRLPQFGYASSNREMLSPVERSEVLYANVTSSSI